MRSLAVAQHEAAHVVVGTALGLRLDRAALARPGARWPELAGHATFYVPSKHRQAWALTVAAGLAWERAVTGKRWPAPGAQDARLLRRAVKGRHAVEACITAAGAILAARGVAHARVTRALCERDLGAADVARLARGERLAGPDDLA